MSKCLAVVYDQLCSWRRGSGLLQISLTVFEVEMVRSSSSERYFWGQSFDQTGLGGV
jgi:hypothetical protein